jgi:hypothetical protein
MYRTTAEEHDMTDTRTPTDAAARRRKQQHRRVKRGIVASYIHQLSERHGENALPREPAMIARPQEKAA